MSSVRSSRHFFTKGLVVGLTEFLMDDYKLFYQTWKDPSTQRNFNTVHGYDSFKDFFALFTNPDRPPQRFNAAVVRLKDQASVGRISLAPIHQEPDLGIWIYKPYRFTGYGTEAVQLAVSFIFGTFDLEYIIAGIYEHNQPSIDLFTNVGFKRAQELDVVENSAFGDGKITQLGFRMNKTPSTMNIPHAQVEALLHEAAEREIMPYWQNLGWDDVSEKTPGELTTIADKQCESFLASRLTSLIDGSVALGEESVHENPGLLSVLHSDAPVWIIDPLDGTRNFVSGRTPFAVMVGLVYRGETVGAWILNPIDGVLTSAEKGSGACQGSSRQVVDPSLQPLSSLRGALLTAFLPDSLRPAAEAASGIFRSIERTRCAGYNYCAFARNDMQFLFYYRTLVWDHAPGVLIAEEAGGFVRRLDGTEYSPADTRKGLLCASNREMWEAIQRKVVPSISVSG